MANPDIGAWFEDRLKGITDLMREVAEDGAIAGRDATKGFVDTRGTAKSGKAGRVETGAMRDAVDGKLVSSGPLEAVSEFGWIEGTPEYARFQEPGFTHVGGSKVEGMYALVDAKDIARQKIKEDLERGLRGL